MADTKKNSPEDVKKTENEGKEGVGLQAKAEKGVSRGEIDDLKSEVARLSTELDTAVVDLKNSVVDIRSAVSEIENPFNLLRMVQSQKDLKNLDNEKLLAGVKSIVVGKPEKIAPEEEKPEEGKSEEELPPLEEKEPLEPQLELKPKIEEPQPQVQKSLRKGASDYLDWVWSLLDSGLSSDDILQLAKSYEFLGYLPEKSSEYIYSLALAAEKMKFIGLKKKHMLLSMYQAASISGIQIRSEDVNAIVSMVQSDVRRSRRSPEGNK